ncbi:MAG: hypothetical protein AAFN18_00875 [Cyanobacteria bacterium J06554_6]
MPVDKATASARMSLETIDLIRSQAAQEDKNFSQMLTELALFGLEAKSETPDPVPFIRLGLPLTLNRWIDQQVSSGAAESPQEAICYALRLAIAVDQEITQSAPVPTGYQDA